MTKAELVSKVSKRTGASQAMTANIVDSIWAEIKELLKRGGSISFTGFGSFDVSKRAKRRGRNPQTGEEMLVPASKVARFRAGKALRAAVNGKK